MFWSQLPLRLDEGWPELSPMLSGFAAHSDPIHLRSKSCFQVLVEIRNEKESRLINGGDMPNRSAKSIAAVFASFLASAIFLILTHGAQAAGECISAPNTAGPEGSHWYYRVERTTQRHCWYLLVGHDKLSQSASSTSLHTRKAPAPAASVQRPIADARAELASQAKLEQVNRDQTRTASADQETTELQSDSVDTVSPGAIVATRWPEPSGVSPLINSPPATASYMTADAQANSPAPPPSTIAAAPPATADPSQLRSASIPMLLAVMAGALALAGITASVVLKLAGTRGQTRSPARRERFLEFTEGDKIPLSAQPVVDDLPRRGPFPRDLDQFREAKEKIAEFRQRPSKRAQAEDR